MALFGSLELDILSMSPTEIAYQIGVDICRYVEDCYPGTGEQFNKLIALLSEDQEGTLGDYAATQLITSMKKGESFLGEHPAFFFLPSLCIYRVSCIRGLCL